jgi:uncharacterized protein (DUF983 family)
MSEISNTTVGRSSGATRRRWSRAYAVVRLRCPRCRRGLVYRSGTHMNNLCPKCGLKFEREQGYFGGALYVGAAIVMFLLGALTFLLSTAVSDVGFAWSVAIACLVLLPLAPAVVRYSKVIWMTLDRTLDPGRGRSRWGEPFGSS